MRDYSHDDASYDGEKPTAPDEGLSGCAVVVFVLGIGALVAAIVLLANLIANTNPDRWEPIASPDEHPLAFVADPRQPRTVYMGTEQGDVLISHDGAQTWVTQHTGLPPAPVSALALLPNDTGLVATSGSGVYTSSDGGKTWHAKGSGIPPDDIVDAVAVLPDGTLLAGTAYHGVYALRPSQSQWQPASAGLPPHADIYTLLALPGEPGHLLAGLVANGIFASNDGGATWTPSSSGLSAPGSLDVFSLLSVPQAGKNPPSAILAGTSNGVYRSGDSGATWHASSTGIGTTRVISLAPDPLTPTTVIVAGTDDGVSESTNGGVSWRSVGYGLPAGEHIGMVGVVHPTGSDQVLLASAEQLYRYPGAELLATQPWRAFAVLLLLLLMATLAALVYWLLHTAGMIPGRSSS